LTGGHASARIRRVAPRDLGPAHELSRGGDVYLAEITRRMTGSRRTAIETFNRLVVLGVAGFMVWYGWKNAMLDLGSYRMPSLIPLTVYTGVVPLAGLLIMLFCVEQLINGLRGGYEGPEDTELLPEEAGE
jgi:TRAP-type C4-dicarboxylate transport system permease small subunit